MAPTTPAGTYDIAWGLLSEDLTENFGLAVEAAALTVGGTATAPAPPPAARPPAAPPQVSGPVDAVRLHYAQINARNFAAAWDLFSPRLQSTMRYESWAAGHENTRSVQTAGVSVVSQSGGQATVAVTLVAVDAVGSGTLTKTFQGSWALVQSGGVWKLDAASITQTN